MHLARAGFILLRTEKLAEPVHRERSEGDE
jgi:hypothetical protein